MRILRGRIPVMGLALFAVLTFVFPGCTVWKINRSRPDELVATRKPPVVRVTGPNNRRVEIWSPMVVGDSLVSGPPPPRPWVRSSRKQDEPPPRAAMALADIRSVEVQGISASRTTFLVLGLGATFAALVIASAFSGPTEPSPWSNSESCPLLYSWDGKAWRLDSGTYGGAILEPLARADVDNLEHATAAHGVLKLRLSDKADETEFVDALSLVAADHEPGLSVAPDGKGELHAFGPLTPPTRARDFGGRDATARVSALDGWSWESLLRERDPGDPAELRDGLEIEFPRPAGDGPLCLVLDAHDTPWVVHLMATYVQAHGSEEPAWQREAAAHPAEARAEMGKLFGDAMLEAALWTADGWRRQGAFWPAGPEVAKRQVLPIDASRAAGETVRVRLAGIPSFWLVDQVALAPLSPRPVRSQEVPLAAARDRRGRDVRALLSSVDGRPYRMATGDAAELTFRAPAIPAGKARTYLAKTTGWYRIHCDTTRAPDRALLDRLAHEPGAVARVSAERMNAALRAMALASP